MVKYLGQFEFTIDGMRYMGISLVGKLHAGLQQDLLLLKNKWDYMPTVDLSKLEDDPLNTQAGWNFLVLEENQIHFPVDGKTRLHERIMGKASDSNQRSSSVKPSKMEATKVNWSEDKIWQYLNKVKAWLGELLAAINVTGGMAWRSAEMLDVKYQNCNNNSRRSIYINKGRLEFVGTYRGCQVHRFLLDRVGVLVLYYLYLVQPFVEILHQHLGLVEESGPWLWQPHMERNHYETDDSDEIPCKNDPEFKPKFNCGEKPQINLDVFWDKNDVRLAFLAFFTRDVFLRHCNPEKDELATNDWQQYILVS